MCRGRWSGAHQFHGASQSHIINLASYCVTMFPTVHHSPATLQTGARLKRNHDVLLFPVHWRAIVDTVQGKSVFCYVERRRILSRNQRSHE